MTRRIQLSTELSVEDLERRYREAKDPVERSRWQMLWLLAQGQTAQPVAANTGYTAYWVGQIARRYNQHGVDGVRNRWRQAAGRTARVPPAVQAELRQALAGAPPAGEQWTGRTVAAWLSTRLGQAVPYWLG